VNDLDVQLTDDILHQLAVEDSLQQEFGQLSLNALSSAVGPECIQIRGRVQNKVFLLLLDSGSSNSFVSSAFVLKAGLSTISTSPQQVRLPNGEVLISDRLVPSLTWWCQGHTLSTDMRVLDLDVYDGILGYDWLKLHSPMTCDWTNKQIQFQQGDTLVTIQGMQSPPLQLSPLSADKLVKYCKGNDVWAFAMVEASDSVTPTEIHPAVQPLLATYSDLFQLPTTLPPSRVHDHAIPLLPEAVPVNARPYRYSPTHKSELRSK